MDIRQINKRLRTISPVYSARLVPAAIARSMMRSKSC
jgi:hypothetical protein